MDDSSTNIRRKSIQVEIIVILAVKRHISAFEHKPKISVSDLIEGTYLALHRTSEYLDLYSINSSLLEPFNHLARINKKVTL